MNKNESKYFNTAIKMDEALITLLEKKDFEYITIREICATAGVNRSTFYLHYENTADLLRSGGGTKVVIVGRKTQKGIPHAAAYQIGLLALLLQRAHHIGLFFFIKVRLHMPHNYDGNIKMINKLVKI